MATGILEEPAFKLVIKQLKNAQVQTVSLEETENKPFYCKWNINFEDPSNDVIVPICICNVWIQGCITEIFSENGNKTVIVDDGTGIAMVSGLSNLPQSTLPLQTGSLVMVIGHIMHVNILHPFTKTPVTAKLKAIKVSEIAQHNNCRPGKWWTCEVRDAQHHIAMCQSKQDSNQLLK